MASSGITLNFNISDSSIREFFDGRAKVESAKRTTRMADVLLELVNIYKSSSPSKCPMLGKSNCSKQFMNLLGPSLKGIMDETEYKSLYEGISNIFNMSSQKKDSEPSDVTLTEEVTKEDVCEEAKDEDMKDTESNSTEEKIEETKSESVNGLPEKFIPNIGNMMDSMCSILGQDQFSDDMKNNLKSKIEVLLPKVTENSGSTSFMSMFEGVMTGIAQNMTGGSTTFDISKMANGLMSSMTSSMESKNDETHLPNDATHLPNDATHLPNDATHLPNDATHLPNDEMD